MIMTRKGSLMPRVFFGSDGQVMYVVLENMGKRTAGTEVGYVIRFNEVNFVELT